MSTRRLARLCPLLLILLGVPARAVLAIQLEAEWRPLPIPAIASLAEPQCLAPFMKPAIPLLASPALSPIQSTASSPMARPPKNPSIPDASVRVLSE
jgi:hypothetical protein